MKQIVMEGPKKSRVVEVEIPKPKEGELLIKVVYTGLCHSEYYPWTVAAPGDRYGHEPYGIVAEVGPNVTGFKVGDRVSGLGGGYAEYVTVNAAYTVHVPDNVADEDAVAEPLGCLLSVASKMPILTPGDPVAVVGAGYMGLGMVSLFNIKGAGRIVVVDPRMEARENALRFGATEVYAPEELPVDYRLTFENFDNIFEKGFATVMEFAGTESGLRLAGDMTRTHGLLGIGGYHNDCDRTVDFKLWNVKGITALSTHERRSDFQTHCCRNALDMLSSGIWNFKGLCTNIYSMEEFDQANYDMENKPKGFIKGLVRCSY
jgi:threonine dehydrogenase-like Zn-dependent dehydrogenase